MNIVENDLKRIARTYDNFVESRGPLNAYLKKESKKLGIQKEELLSLIRKYVKEEKKLGNHYHSTSLEDFEKIVQNGKLLSEDERAKAGIEDNSKNNWSSSKDVMFTYDGFDENGILADSQSSRGLLVTTGASGSEITFVIGESILQENDYDCFGRFPTINKLDIRKHCIAILASTPEVMKKAEEILKENDMQIPVTTKEEFIKDYKNATTKSEIQNIVNNLYFEKQISGRDEESFAKFIEETDSQDINSNHDIYIARTYRDIEARVFKYMLGDTSLEDVGKQLGKDYAKGLSGDKSELAEVFGTLEAFGRYGEFQNPFIKQMTDGYEDPKYLLQLEKLDGVTFMTNDLSRNPIVKHKIEGEVFLATYEMEVYDEKLGRNVVKPVKEYFQKGEDGRLEKVGQIANNKASFRTPEGKFEVENRNITNGESKEKVTQKELAEKFRRNEIKDSIGKQVLEVAEITDTDFLCDFAEQCGIEPVTALFNKTYIVSSLNEKGEEEFDVLFREDDATSTSYVPLEGLYKSDRAERNISKSTGKYITPGMEMFNVTKSQAEFDTRSGNRYAITRDRNGKLGFSEIYKETPYSIYAKDVDVHTFSPEHFKELYQTQNISDEDLRKALDTLNRTKQQMKERTNEANSKGER